MKYKHNKYYTEFTINKATIEALDKDLMFIDYRYSVSGRLIARNEKIESKFYKTSEFDHKFAKNIINRNKRLIPSFVLANYGIEKNIKQYILKQLRQYIDMPAYMRYMNINAEESQHIKDLEYDVNELEKEVNEREEEVINLKARVDDLERKNNRKTRYIVKLQDKNIKLRNKLRGKDDY